MKQAMEQRLIKQATDELSRFGLPLKEEYDAKIEGEGSPCAIVFTNRKNPELKVRMANVWCNRQGEFVEYGNNFGELVF